MLSNGETTIPQKSSVFVVLQLSMEMEVSQTAEQEGKPGYHIQQNKRAVYLAPQ